MELTTVLGISLAIVSMVIAFVLEGGHITALFAPTAFLIVFGGTIGATVTCFTMAELKTLPGVLKTAITKQKLDPASLIDLIVKLADKARRDGLLSLESSIDEVDSPFLKKGIQLIVDGTDPEVIQNILETENYAVEERHSVGSNIFEVAGGFAPTMGIIGTVMGLVHVLGNLSNPDELGPAIAMAFIATLYGVGSANIVYLPLAEKLKNTAKKEGVMREIMMEGLIALRAGRNPIIIREHLTAFLRPEKKGDKAPGDEED